MIVKKLLTVLLVAEFTLTACGRNTTHKTKTSKNEQIKVQEEKETRGKLEDQTKYANRIGKTIKYEELDIKIVKAGSVENKFITGPINLRIIGIMIGKMTPKDELLKRYYDNAKEIPIVLIYAEIENTTDNRTNFNFTQTTITTNTQEQVNSDIWVSGGNSEFLGRIKAKQVAVFYPEADLEELNELKLYIDAPSNENFETIGDDLVLTLKFDGKGILKSIE